MKPVASDRRLAARPVGAAREMRRPRALSARTTTRVMVVLPVPGPPVMMDTLCPQADSTAWRCSSDRVRDWRCSSRSTAPEIFFGSMRTVWSSNARRREAISRSVL